MEQLRPLLGRWLMREQEAAYGLKRLAMEEAAAVARQDAACLRGILAMLEQRLPPAPPGSSQAGARQLYGESLRLWREYTAHADDPEYGPVFAALAEHKTQRCVLLLRRLGKG